MKSSLYINRRHVHRRQWWHVTNGAKLRNWQATTVPTLLLMKSQVLNFASDLNQYETTS